VAEIATRLRNAGDYLGAIVGHEAAAAAAATGPTQDLEAQKEAGRLFARDLQAFVAAARTAWNYLNQAADAAGCRVWLDERLDDCLYKFHRELANQDTHAHEAILGVNQKLRWEAEANTPMIPAPGGKLPIRVTVVAFEGMTYHYNPKELEPDVAALYERVLLVHGNKTVVEYALRYFDALQSTFKNAERRGRFVA
jgi:hypothetical protein